MSSSPPSSSTPVPSSTTLASYGLELGDRARTREECVICQENMTNPVVTHCLHAFCWECLYAWIRRQRTSCPACRRNMAMAVNSVRVQNPAARMDRAGEVWRSPWDRTEVARRRDRLLPVEEVRQGVVGDALDGPFGPQEVVRRGEVGADERGRLVGFRNVEEWNEEEEARRAGIWRTLYPRTPSGPRNEETRRTVTTEDHPEDHRNNRLPAEQDREQAAAPSDSPLEDRPTTTEAGQPEEESSNTFFELVASFASALDFRSATERPGPLTLGTQVASALTASITTATSQPQQPRTPSSSTATSTPSPTARCAAWLTRNQGRFTSVDGDVLIPRLYTLRDDLDPTNYWQRNYMGVYLACFHWASMLQAHHGQRMSVVHLMSEMMRTGLVDLGTDAETMNGVLWDLAMETLG